MKRCCRLLQSIENEKFHYISSVQCALRKPAVRPAIAGAGALSRDDDLVATHINPTMTIHFVVCSRDTTLCES